MHNQPDNEKTFTEEPEAIECPDCGSSMREEIGHHISWLSCDKCPRIIFEGDDYE